MQMKCPKCNAEVADHVKFCGKCGSKIEAPPVVETEIPKKYCPQCGKEVSSDAGFCKECGKNLAVQQPEVEVPKVEPPTVEAVKEVEPSPAEPVTPPVVAPIEETPKPSTKFFSKRNIIIAAVALVIICVILVIPKGSSKSSHDTDLMVYTDNDKVYVLAEGGTGERIKASTYTTLLMSKDGKIIYSLDDGDLYVKEGSKEAEKVVSDIKFFTITTDGKTVAYIKDPDSYGIGDLYVKSLGKEAVKISSDVGTNVELSPNGQYVSFTAVDTKNWEYTGYVAKIGKDKVKLGEYFPIYIDDKGTVLMIDEADVLYLNQYEKDREKIANDVCDIIVNNNTSKIMYTNYSGDLYYYNGKDKEKIDSNVYYFEKIQDVARVHSTGQLYQVDRKDINLVYYKSNGLYVTYDGNEAQKVSSGVDTGISISEDFKTIIYDYKDKIIKKTFSATKMTSEEELADNVEDFYISRNQKYLVYYDDDEDYYMYKEVGAKKATKLKEDIEVVLVEDNGTIYFRNDIDALYVTKNQKDYTKLKDDVVSMVSNNAGLLYFRDEDGTLYSSNNGKTPVKIASDITSSYLKKVVNSYSYVSY